MRSVGSEDGSFGLMTYLFRQLYHVDRYHKYSLDASTRDHACACACRGLIKERRKVAVGGF